MINKQANKKCEDEQLIMCIKYRMFYFVDYICIFFFRRAAVFFVYIIIIITTTTTIITISFYFLLQSKGNVSFVRARHRLLSQCLIIISYVWIIINI